MPNEIKTTRKEKADVSFDFQDGYTIVAATETDYKRLLSELKKKEGLKVFIEAKMIVGVITPYNPSF